MRTLYTRAVRNGILLLVCLSGFALAASPQYTFSAAGNYPGASKTFPQADSLTQIVGYYVTPTVSFGYIQDIRQPISSRYMSVQPPGSWVSWLSGINSHGVAVGGYCSPPQGCNFPQGTHGFTYNHGIYTTIDYPGDETTVALGINDNGDIVGGHCPHQVCPDGLNPTDHAFLDSNGTFTELDYPAAIATEANAINNLGQIVGVYETIDGGPHGFLYENGTYTNIDVPGSTFTNVSAINNRGMAAGYYQLNHVTIHGFIRNVEGRFTTVDYPGTDFSSLDGINDVGTIVGVWSPSQGLPLTFKGVPIRASK